MNASLAYFHKDPNQNVDHETVEMISREVSKIITEQIRQNIPVETKSQKSNIGSNK